MRTTIACQRCRNAKIKCHHDGTAPCKACASRQDPNCVLTAPVITRNSRRKISTNHRLNIDDPQHNAVSRTPRYAATDSPSVPPSPRIHLDRCTVLLNHVSNEQARAACNHFLKQYPVYGFLHKPTFFDQLDSGKVSPVKLCAILALCGHHEQGNLHASAGRSEGSESFAAAAREVAMARIDQKPDVDLVQSLILLSLHYWGNCDSFKAWTLSGLSARICQTFTRFIRSPTANQARRRSRHLSPDEAALCTRETICRTYWASFITECMLSSGRQLPSNHKSFDLSVPLPLGEDDFEFCNSNLGDTQVVGSSGDFISHLSGKDTPLGANEFQKILIIGFKIWADISQWICDGGRRTPEPESACAPWKIGSAWTRLMSSVQLWRSRMSSRMLYSPTNSNLKVHVSRSQGEAFVTVHLLYCLHVIFLHREYIPFLAHRIRRPCGPVDPPLILETSPDGWWEDGSKALFEAAVSIVELLQEIQSHGVSHNTPFSCFCVFGAGASLCYLDAWPHMAPQIKDAKVRYEWTLSSLHEAENRWPICKGWRETLLRLETLYRNINAGGDIYSHVGRDQFIQLEDRLHRFAEAEPPQSDELDSTISNSPTLERAHNFNTRQQSSNYDLSSAVDHPTPQLGTLASRDRIADQQYLGSPAATNRADLLPWDFNYAINFTPSQDLLGSMLGAAPFEDWFYDV